jgi:hypothetical protein
MSNTASRRASAVTRALLAAHPRLKRAQDTNFYSIQMNDFIQPQILQPTENKALHFFYSVQMRSRQRLITNHYSPKHGDSKWPKN